MRCTSVVLAALCLQAASLNAQQYRRTPGDTLRYRETSRITTQSDSPNGSVSIGIESSGLLSIAFLPADSARVWYDTITTKIDSPMGDMGGDVARQLMKKPFTIRFGPNGSVETVSAPSIQSPGGPMIMQNAFHEWFPRLPAAIAIGTVWQDTLKGEISPMPELTTKSTSIRHFRVARDSTVSGLRVLVIETTGTTETSGGGSMGGVTVTSNLKGDFTGVILYAPNPGIIVARISQSKMDGTTEMSGSMSMSMPQRSQIESRVELIRK
jgi:hypothetical protein